jgi:hypothetical protein
MIVCSIVCSRKAGLPNRHYKADMTNLYQLLTETACRLTNYFDLYKRHSITRLPPYVMIIFRSCAAGQYLPKV